MTPKQAERIKEKIKKIKKALAADKKHWGGFHHDGQGLRYLIPELYLKLEDYTGALRYFNWFDKNFPEDTEYPMFLFERTITLFKTKRIKQAEKKAMQTFESNMYLLDQFLGKKSLHINKDENSNWAMEQLTEFFTYSNENEELKDFSIWLEKFIKTDKFNGFVNRLIQLEAKLKTEEVEENIFNLVKEKENLINEFCN